MLICSFGAENVSRDLASYSETIGAELPEELTAFLKKYNGGETPNTSFSCGEESSDIVAFYGVGDVKYSYSNVKPFQRNDEMYLPIAFDSFGNTIVIAMHSKKIFFSDHETDRLTFLANDFRSFIAACNSEPIKPSALRSIEEREHDLIQRGRGAIITDDLRKMWQAEIDKYRGMKQEKVIF